MATSLTFDASLAQRIEASYATPDVAATRGAVFKAAAPRTGETALDVGCGPGYLTLELAKAVGQGGRVIGVDLSDAMLRFARQRCADLPQVRLEQD
jgi:arsenite methyltransferase